MVAGVFGIAEIAIDPGIGKPLGKIRRQQQMVEPKARIAWPTIAPITPEGIGATLGIPAPKGIGPALLDDAAECLAAPRMDERTAVP